MKTRKRLKTGSAGNWTPKFLLFQDVFLRGHAKCTGGRPWPGSPAKPRSPRSPSWDVFGVKAPAVECHSLGPQHAGHGTSGGSSSLVAPMSEAGQDAGGIPGGALSLTQCLILGKTFPSLTSASTPGSGQGVVTEIQNPAARWLWSQPSHTAAWSRPSPLSSLRLRLLTSEAGQR